jgi:class 3 adenylate cyclase
MVEAAPVASIRSAKAERRYLTILFCDLVGYTRLSEQLDPEDLQGIQREYHSLVRTVMGRYSGFVARFSGDGVLVWLDIQRAENDADAVRALD